MKNLKRRREKAMGNGSFCKVIALVLLVFAVTQFGGTNGLAAEKLKFGSAVKLFPPYYLVVMAAEEKGFWKGNGLEAEWIATRGSAALIQSIAARAIKIGISPSVTALQAAGRGLPVILISELVDKAPFFVWVRTDSRFKKPQDLRGVKFGVTRLGGAGHAYARLVTKALGLEKEVRFVGSGGIRQELAALRAGAIDASVMGLAIMLRLKVKGVIREILNVHDYLPKEWIEHVLFARKELVRDKPDTVRKVLRSVLQSIQFVNTNPDWAVKKMKEVSGYPEEAARLMFKDLRLSQDGKINQKAIENMRNFLIDYGIASKEKIPPVQELYTTAFTG